MKCRKTGPKPLFEIELLSKATLQTQAVFDQRTTAISFMLLTDANDCFSSLIIFSVNLLIVYQIMSEIEINAQIKYPQPKMWSLN